MKFSLHTDGTSLPAESCGCIVFCFLGNCGKSFPQTLHFPYLLVRCRSNTTQSTTSLTSLSLPFICCPCLSLIAMTFKEKQRLLLQPELQADFSFKMRIENLLLLRDIFVIFSSCFLCGVQCFNGSSWAFFTVLSNSRHIMNIGVWQFHQLSCVQSKCSITCVQVWWKGTGKN